MLRWMLRSEVPVSSAPNSSAAKTVPIAVLRPSSATAIPRKPTCEVWMSFVNRLNFQPSMSIAAASPANTPQIAIARIVVAADVDAGVARGVGVVADGARPRSRASSGS